jgi:DNA-binding HxlR family transcriptional regulator
VVPVAHERRRYEQFCPVARALDVLGGRWTLLVVRELLTGPKRYSDLRTHLPGMWSNLLAQRLRDLEHAAIVQRTELPPPAARTVYELTERGRALHGVMYELARWGLPYLDMPTDEEPLQPHLLPEGIRALVLLETLPKRAFVAHLVLDEGEFTVRIAPPGPGPLVARVAIETGAPALSDVAVHGSAGAALLVRRGEWSYDDAVATGALRIDGEERAVDTARALFGFR